MFNLTCVDLGENRFVDACRLSFDGPLGSTVEPHKASTYGYLIAESFCEELKRYLMV